MIDLVVYGFVALVALVCWVIIERLSVAYMTAKDNKAEYERIVNEEIEQERIRTKEWEKKFGSRMYGPLDTEGNLIRSSKDDIGALADELRKETNHDERLARRRRRRFPSWEPVPLDASKLPRFTSENWEKAFDELHEQHRLHNLKRPSKRKPIRPPPAAVPISEPPHVIKDKMASYAEARDEFYKAHHGEHETWGTFWGRQQGISTHAPSRRNTEMNDLEDLAVKHFFNSLDVDEDDNV